jgi:hypothetical protein
MALTAASPVLAADAAKANEAALRNYLSTRLGPPLPSMEKISPSRYSVAWIDLNGDGRPEALVYISGRDWCGSGGCRLLVLERRRSVFKVRANTMIAWTPVGVLRTTRRGWRDVTVEVHGGGVSPGYIAALSFDGRRYPMNPSVAPARRVAPGERQDIVIPSEAKTALLYP